MDEFLRKLHFSASDTHEFQTKISQLDQFKGFWTGSLNISPQILSRLQQTAIITSTGASTRIEGAYLTDSQVRNLLKGLKIKKLQDRSQQEVAGYAELTRLVFENYSVINFDESLIKHFHTTVLKYSTKDAHHRGKYKVGSNSVIARDSLGGESIVFEPTPPYLVAKEMLELVNFVNQSFANVRVHPLLLIGYFVVEFLAIHPFQDGNGRTSRILTNLLLLQQGYEYVQYASLEKIIEDRKDDYYLALMSGQKNRATRDHDLTEWICFFLDTLLIQKDVALSILEGRQPEDQLSEKQLLVLAQFAEEPLSISALAERTNLNRNTLKKILERLRSLNLLQQVGLGRGSRWKRL